MALRQLVGTRLVPVCSAAVGGRYWVLSLCLQHSLAPMETRRCCHDNSKQKSVWVNSTMSRFHQDGYQNPPHDYHTQREDIISELNTLIADQTTETQARHSIQSRIATLECLGCSLDDIQAHPDVLLLTELEVIKRVQRLRRFSVDKMTVRMLKAASTPSRMLLQKRLDTFEKGSIVEQVLADLLECSIEELLDLEEKNPAFLWVNSPEKVLTKVQFLLSIGFTPDDIKQNVFILRKGMKVIGELINGVQLIRCGSRTNIDRETLQLFIDSENVGRTRPCKVEDKQRLLARLLGVEVADIRDIRYTNVTFHTVVKKLMYLLQLGIEKKDVLNHFYLLRHSFKKLEGGVAAATAAGISEMTAITLVNILQHRYIPPRIGRPRHQAFLSAILGLSPAEFKALGPHVGRVCATDKMTLKTNLKYLLGEGFSLEEVRRCLLAVTHDPDVLQVYVECLPDRPEFQPYEELACDRNLVLNAVQYLIEKDSNFSCSKEQMGAGMSHDQTVGR